MLRFCVLLMMLTLVGCGSPKPIEVWVAEPTTRRPYPNVSVEVSYASWPQWPGWLSWMPSGTPESTRAATGPMGVATLSIPSDDDPNALIVAGQSFAFQRADLKDSAVYRTQRLYIVVRPIEP